MSFQKGASEIGLGLEITNPNSEAQMEFSITRLEQVAKILAEEIKAQMVEKQGINEMEHMMRELVKAAAGLGLQ